MYRSFFDSSDIIIPNSCPIVSNIVRKSLRNIISVKYMTIIKIGESVEIAKTKPNKSSSS
jgi:hypothetical protein